MWNSSSVYIEHFKLDLPNLFVMRMLLPLRKCYYRTNTVTVIHVSLMLQQLRKCVQALWHRVFKIPDANLFLKALVAFPAIAWMGKYVLIDSLICDLFLLLFIFVYLFSLSFPKLSFIFRQIKTSLLASVSFVLIKIYCYKNAVTVARYIKNF